VYASTTEAPVLLVGTAHVVDLAEPIRRTLSDRALQAIALELDDERAAAVLAPREGPGAEAARSTRGPIFLRLWAILQRRLGDQLGAGAGAEMRAAAACARDWGLPLFLIDDPLRETLGRLVRSLGPRERLRLVLGSLLGLFVPASVVHDQIGEYESAPGDLLEEMRAQFPGVTRVLIDERNEHMAERLAALRTKGYGRLAAVVGDAHVAGLADALHRRGVPVEVVPLAALRAPRAS
jgi:pheromone shutdown protein TraB